MSFSKNGYSYFLKLMLISLVFIHIGGGKVSAQQFKFNHYSALNGLPQQYIYAIAQNSNGYLWLATSTGVIRFDGDAFNVFGAKDGLAEDFTTCLFVSKNGQMWAGHNRGGVSLYKNGQFNKVLTSSSGFGNIVGFDELSNNSIVAAGQSGKVLVNKNNTERVYDFSGDDMVLSAMATAMDNVLLLGTDGGVYKYKLRNYEPLMSSKERLEGIPEEKIQCIVRSKNNPNVLWTATASGQLYKLTVQPDGKINVLPIVVQTATFLNIQQVFEDKNGNVWVSTYGGVHKLIPAVKTHGTYLVEIAYTQSNGLPGDQVKCVFQDHDNNTWFGLYGSGLAMLKDEFFTFYQYKNAGFSNNIQSILVDNGKKYFGSDYGLGCIDCYTAGQEINNGFEKGLEKQSITVLKKFNETLLAGTARGGLFVYNISTKSWKNVFYSKQDNLANAITDIEVVGNAIWLGTRGGLFALSTMFEVLELYNTETGMPHNSVNDIYVDHRGKVWVSTQSNMVATIVAGKLELIEVMGPSQSINITCITEDNEHNIWMGTYGNGVFRQQFNKFTQISMGQNLASDYCYFIVAGNNNDIWVGHRGALSRIEVKGKKITIFDDSDGIDCDFNDRASYKDAFGNLWFGSNKGIIKFDPKKYINNSALPKINIKSILVSDQEVEINKAIKLPYRNYRLVISFIGINFNNPQKVKYKYILKGFDLDWSDVTENNQAYYPKLSDGEYEFIVKACNEDEVFGEASARIKINVAYPFWKQWWFIFLSIALSIAIIIGIIKLRERNQKKIRIYLEEQLQIRTRELVEQKALVEHKNKDITDSINYAYKIQSGLLPSVNEIKKYLPQFFVVNKPRDIVSGDFYWYCIKGDYLNIAVADCTGHGVPGAFMSAIGNLIFRKMSEYSDDIDPANFISNVDNYLTSLMNPERETLNQDGMDMVLVKVNLKTGQIVFSGARRPLLHFKKDGTNELHKTSADSIGGFSNAKKFTNVTIQLEKGDTIYLFSDGIVDQFGGPMRKKIMTRGLIKLLEDSLHLTMNEQSAYVDSYFETWKGKNNQIDDVILVGIRY